MGWPANQSLATDVNYILAAKVGRVDMLQAIFGKADDKPDETQVAVLPSNKPGEGGSFFVMPVANAPPITADLFDETFH